MSTIKSWKDIGALVHKYRNRDEPLDAPRIHFEFRVSRFAFRVGPFLSWVWIRVFLYCPSLLKPGF
jgi:hypothetical protein